MTRMDGAGLGLVSGAICVGGCGAAIYGIPWLLGGLLGSAAGGLPGIVILVLVAAPLAIWMRSRAVRGEACRVHDEKAGRERDDGARHAAHACCAPAPALSPPGGDGKEGSR